MFSARLGFNSITLLPIYQWIYEMAVDSSESVFDNVTNVVPNANGTNFYGIINYSNLVFKFDNYGNILWQFTVSLPVDPNVSIYMPIVVDSSENVYVGVVTTGTGISNNLYLLKLNSYGDIQYTTVVTLSSNSWGDAQLVLSQTNNVLYIFGQYSTGFQAYVIRINTTNGSILNYTQTANNISVNAAEICCLYGTDQIVGNFHSTSNISYFVKYNSGDVTISNAYTQTLTGYDLILIAMTNGPSGLIYSLCYDTINSYFIINATNPSTGIQSASYIINPSPADVLYTDICVNSSNTVYLCSNAPTAAGGVDVYAISPIGTIVWARKIVWSSYNIHYASIYADSGYLTITCHAYSSSQDFVVIIRILDSGPVSGTYGNYTISNTSVTLTNAGTSTTASTSITNTTPISVTTSSPTTTKTTTTLGPLTQTIIS
jgi:hypothetical protein